MNRRRYTKERTKMIQEQGYDPRPNGPRFVRRAKNAEREYELETGSVRARASGGGHHHGKPIFGHGYHDRDAVGAQIGKKTKQKKWQKARKRALNNRAEY